MAHVATSDDSYGNPDFRAEWDAGAELPFLKITATSFSTVSSTLTIMGSNSIEDFFAMLDCLRDKMRRAG